MPSTKDQDLWMLQVLGAALPGVGEPGEEPLDVEAEMNDLESLGLEVFDLWTAAVERFNAANEEVAAQISQLQAALRETDDPDLHDIAEFGLNGLTGNTRVPLMAAMREASLGPAQLKQHAPRVLSAVSAFAARLTSEEVRACDNNPFDVPMSIEGLLSGPLEEMSKAATLATR